jgi:hypothetical protein
MQSAAWAALLRHIPPEAHGNLMVVTLSGTEIALQSILRIDHEFLAFKGRLAGSQDAGRLFFLPFAQIDYLGFQQPVKDTEYQEMFGTLEVPAPVAPLPATALPDPLATAEADPEPPAPAPEAAPEPVEPAPPAAPSQAGRTSAPIKSAVLERFRARAQQPGSGVRPPVSG